MNIEGREIVDSQPRWSSQCLNWRSKEARSLGKYFLGKVSIPQMECQLSWITVRKIEIVLREGTVGSP